MHNTRVRIPALIVTALTVAVTITACTGEEPTPLPVPTIVVTPSNTATPTPQPIEQASEEDIANAIKTYEAYVEASDQVVLADRTTWEPMLALLGEPYLSSEIEAYSKLADEGAVMSGTSYVKAAEVTEAVSGWVGIHVCSDFTERLLSDASGQIVSPDGTRIMSLDIALRAEASAERGWVITMIRRSDLPC